MALMFNCCEVGKQNDNFILHLCFFSFKNVSLSLSNYSTFDSYPFIHTVTSPSAPQLPTIEPLGVVLGSTQWWQAAQAAVNGGVSP